MSRYRREYSVNLLALNWNDLKNPYGGGAEVFDSGQLNNCLIAGNWSGFDGGELARMVDLPLVVRSQDMQQIEDVHMVLAHMLMQAVHGALHPEAGQTAA